MLRWIRGFFTLSLLAIVIGSVHLITNTPFNQKKEHELNVYAYSAYIDHEMLDAFTSETGIKVNMLFYNTNEELITKLNINKGKNIDVIITSDYDCKILKDKDLIQPIDKKRFNSYNKIYPFLLNKPFDPDNEYTIPYTWEIYGIAYDPNSVNSDSISTNLLFSREQNIVMTPDPFEMTIFASQHLFGDKQQLSKKEVQSVIRLLKEQKSTTEAYADFRAKDIISSKNATVTILKSSYIDALKHESDEIEFALPQDVIYTSIESATIGKRCSNLNDAYTFLNYIYKPENLSMTTDLFPSFPACPESLDYGNTHCRDYHQIIKATKERQEDLRFFYDITEKQTVRQIVVEAKA